MNFGKKLRPWIARPSLQSFWRSLYLISRAGMNFGGGSEFDCSGELWVLEFIKRVLKDEQNLVIFDVGAHKGYYATAVLNVFQEQAKVLCFEPSASTFKELEANLSSFKNISLFNFGFGEREETVDLYYTSTGETTASIFSKEQFHTNQSLLELTEKIYLKSLDEFCRENQIKKIDFLKLDVEGNELNIVKGAKELMSSNSINFIQFEFGETNVNSRTYFRDFFYLLNPLYRIYRVLNPGLAPIDKYSHMHEVFRVTNYLAVSRTLLPLS